MHQVFLGESAVAWKARNAEVVRTIVGTIGYSFLHQAFDQAHHIGNVVGGANHFLRRLDSQRLHVLEKSLFEFLRVLTHAEAELGCVLDDAIVHVGNIHHMAQFAPRGTKPAPQHVDRHKRAEIADMAVVVNGRSAAVHAYHMVAGG